MGKSFQMNYNIEIKGGPNAKETEIILSQIT